ncbi:MAG: sigma-70 family RNA polymerase sigma factor, partial [Cyclobacteriaceae bacterium]|nr:sigma-70 family RNA polymerase sigma factor [Cyclobacteriaceae bacterium]
MGVISLETASSARLEDTVVVRRVLSGEKELFEILLRRYNQTLYRVIRGYLRDEADVEDAMQDTYLKAYDKLEQFQGKAAFSTWLIRIGINEALLRLRKLRRVRALVSQEADVDAKTITQLPDTR